MKKSNKAHHLSTSETQRLLGADEPVDLGDLPRDFIGMRALPRIVASRLVSRGGRPSDPEWSMARKIPMRAETWNRLRHLALEAHRLHGLSIAPGQVAAIALEKCVIDSSSDLRGTYTSKESVGLQLAVRSQLTIAKCHLIAQRYGEKAVQEYAQQVADRHQVWTFD